jgi:hypothetical protein
MRCTVAARLFLPLLFNLKSIFMKFLKFTMLFCTLTTLMTACKKNKDQTRSEVLAAKAWKVADHGDDINKNGIIDPAESDLTNCDKDNSFTFATGGTGTFDEGASKCDPSDPQSYAYNWQLTEGETKLTVSLVGIPFTSSATIITLDNSNFVFAEDDGSGVKTISVLKR